MVVFGSLLAVLGLSSCLWRDAAVLGIPPVPLGIALIALGAVSVVIGMVRRRRRRLRIAAGEPEPVGTLVDRARALPRLLRTARQSGYTGLPRGRIALWGFALVYLISPIDILPELLPIIGVTDDAGVAVWLLTSLSAASGRYLRWERERGRLPRS